MTELKNIESQCDHINDELKAFYGNDEKLDNAIDSIKDATEAINTNASNLEEALSEKIEELEDSIEELESKENIDLDFTPACEYHIDSMTGKMSLLSSSMGDDQILDTFSKLAQNIKTSELEYHLKNILLKYPALCKKLALLI